MTAAEYMSNSEPDREMPMTRKIHLTVLAALGCVALLVSGCGGDDGGEDESPRALPKVTGLTLAEAEKRLEGVPVEWTFSAEEGSLVFEKAQESSGGENAKLAGGEVTGQDPVPGKPVISGDIVVLKVGR